ELSVGDVERVGGSDARELLVRGVVPLLRRALRGERGLRHPVVEDVGAAGAGRQRDPVEGNATMSAREALTRALWDNYTAAEKDAFIDAHRDEVALEIGRDALRNGLVPSLTRLVGEANATKLISDL